MLAKISLVLVAVSAAVGVQAEPHRQMHHPHVRRQYDVSNTTVSCSKKASTSNAALAGTGTLSGTGTLPGTGSVGPTATGILPGTGTRPGTGSVGPTATSVPLVSRAFPHPFNSTYL